MTILCFLKTLFWWGMRWSPSWYHQIQDGRTWSVWDVQSISIQLSPGLSTCLHHYITFRDIEKHVSWADLESDPSVKFIRLPGASHRPPEAHHSLLHIFSTSSSPDFTAPQWRVDWLISNNQNNNPSIEYLFIVRIEQEVNPKGAQHTWWTRGCPPWSHSDHLLMLHATYLCERLCIHL